MALGLAVMVGLASFAVYSVYEPRAAQSTSTTSSVSSTISTQQTSSPVSTDGSASIAVSKAVDYLVANFNPATGLTSETPGSSTYWLYSDNFLAALALNHFGQRNTTLITLAADISGSINEDLRVQQLNNAENQYMVLNASAPCQFHPSVDYTIATPDGVQIKTTINNGTGDLSENQYADVAFLKAICLYRQNNASGALTSYNAGKGMFDGVGFRDLPYNKTGQYQTYKLALFIYATAVLKQPMDERALSALLIMQAQNGGFYTGYDANYSHDGTLTNTETTSLAILALSYHG